MSRRQNAGFTLAELMVVVAILSILAAIAVPNFNRSVARARQSEPVVNLKSLYTGLRVRQAKPAGLIRLAGATPERGNRYSYHLDNGCSNFEDRSGIDVYQHNDDTCIGVDTFKYPNAPQVYNPIQAASATWNWQATSNGMSMHAGIFGTDESWDFLLYAAGDADKIVSDQADSWMISSSDGVIDAVCPYTMASRVSAGEPFNISDDVACD
jgi:type IV pilus assembly protein PilA